jgi:diguanylate cyclase (GGDEF)-like protein
VTTIRWLEIGRAVRPRRRRPPSAAGRAGARRAIREGDLAARLGGDEFAVLLRQSEPAALGAIGERLVREVGAVLPVMAGRGPGVSVGMAFLDRPPATATEALRLADRAMCRAQADGAGVVRVARAPGAGRG